VASARNHGFRASSPNDKYLLFLDADDLLEPSMLETLSRYLDEHSSAVMVYCLPAYIDDQDRPLTGAAVALAQASWAPRLVPSGIGVRRLPPHEPRTPFLSIFNLTGLIPSVALIRRDGFVRAGGWDESFGHVFEDTDLFLRLALLGEVHHLPSPLVRYRLHNNQSTADPARIFRQAEKLYTKWASPSGLDARCRAMVREAQRFREARVIPYAGFQAGTRHLVRGQFVQAARFYLGAARRYLASFLV
jgi:GT2 family glycosyltransferase